jgi:hypothetical protein
MDFAALRFASSKDYGTNREKAPRPKDHISYRTLVVEAGE